MKFIILPIIFIILIFPMKCSANPNEIQIDVQSINTYLSSLKTLDINFDKLVDLIKHSNLNDVVNFLLKEIKTEIKYILVNNNKIMYTLIVVCLFSCMIKIIEGNKSDNYSELAIVCFVSGVFTHIYLWLYEIALQTVNSTVGFMQVTLPVFFSVSSVFMNKIPVSVYSTFFIFTNIFQNLVVNIIFPAINIILVLSIVNAVCPDCDTISVKKFILNIVHWMLGLYTTFFIIGIKLTQTITYGTQRLFLTGIKYAVSRSVPIVGSFLSDTAETMISSVVLLHNSIGVAGIVIIIILVFAPFAAIFLLSMIFRLIGSFFSFVSKSNVCSLFIAFSDCLTELAIVLICVSVTFIIAVATEISVF